MSFFHSDSYSLAPEAYAVHLFLNPVPPQKKIQMIRVFFFWILRFQLLVWFGLSLSQSAGAQAVGPSQSSQCEPRIISVQASQAQGADVTARPTEGWVDVQLPDHWTRRWPGYSGTVWYRIDWERSCADRSEPVALGLDGFSSAGEVFSNNDLLYRDASMVEPLSRSWNVPRWWMLQESAVLPGVNSVWLRVVGVAASTPGLSALRLGSQTEVVQHYQRALWSQRTVYFINAVLSGAGAVMFLMIWCLRPKEHAYGWFGLMALAWLVYLTTYLADTPWPWQSVLTKTRFSIVALIAYVLCACIFTFRFGAQKLPHVERVLWVLAAVGSAAVLLVSDEATSRTFSYAWKGAMLIFLANCLQFQWHAWRVRGGERKLSHILLAMVWLVFLVVALYDYFGALGVWQVARSWAALSGTLVITLMMLLLSAQLTQQMRAAERFNRELAQHVAVARDDLEQSQVREHGNALQNAKLQERVQIAHDLHDGLGASLVRSMALVAQASDRLTNDRMLSLLKILRDDLRQVIDYGSSAGMAVPETPVQWFAPLRRRYSLILDDLGVTSEWSIAQRWHEQYRPSALQCMGITRLVEEAVANVIQHSRARHLRVICAQPQPDVLSVSIEDDGSGFDVEEVQQAGVSVGLRSMTARAERMGGKLTVFSGHHGTVVRVVLSLDKVSA